MMRLIRAALLVFVAFVSPAAAAILVKSGEHEGFSRLVVYFEPGQIWSLDETATGYRLEAPGIEDGFDISDVFEMIPRDRISSLAAGSDILVVGLGCRCAINHEVLTSGHLILDVVPTPDNAVRSVFAFKPEILPSDTNPIVEQLIGSVGGANQGEIRASNINDNTHIELNLETHESLEGFRTRLLENLGRSASLSLVDLADKPADTSVGAPILSSLPEQENRAVVTNAIDQARAAVDMPVRIEDLRQCPNPDLFDIANWGGVEEFSDHLSGIRRDLVEEFDEINQEAANALVRAYLYYGLTDEARHVVATLPTNSTDGNALVALSRILDDASSARAPAFDDFGHCRGPILPWLLLEATDKISLSTIDLKNLAAEFSAWSPALQRLLGSRLIRKLNELDRKETAAVLESILTGIGKESPVRHNELTSLPQPELEKIIFMGGDRAPEALAMFLKNALREGELIPAELVQLTGAFAKELRGESIEITLHKLRIEALFYREEVAEAISQITQHEKKHDIWAGELLDRVANHVINARERKTVFHFITYLIRSERLTKLDPNLAIELAEKALEAGLPNYAITLLAEVDGSSVPGELLLDIADARETFQEALGLISKDGDRENAGKVAKLALKHDEIGALSDDFLAELAPDLTNRIAWASSNWTEVKSSERNSEVARSILELQKIDFSDEPLTKARSASSLSERSRDLISQLLQGSE